MIRLILVRHGETIWNTQARYQGQADVPLSTRGWLQAECLAERLTNENIAVIYSSDLTRAADTAQMIAWRLGVSVVLEPRLRELNVGEWQGLSYADVQQRYFKPTDPLPCYPIDQPPRGGESFRQLQTRLLEVVEEIVAKHINQTVLLVLHGGCLRALFCAWLNLELAVYGKLRFDNASVSEVIISREGITVTRLNDCTHLALTRTHVT